MDYQPQMHLLNIARYQTDTVYTPGWVARDMVDFFPITGRVLDPCRGDGAFYDLLPGADYCEIEEGIDFYGCSTKYEWIVGNPPYADFSSWLRHSFSLARNILYLIPANKLFNSHSMIADLSNYGGVVHLRHYGGGSKLGFSIGFAICAAWLQRDYAGLMGQSIYGGDKCT